MPNVRPFNYEKLFDQGWEPPTADELSALCEKNRWGAMQVTRICGVDYITVVNWLDGITTIPYSCWKLLRAAEHPLPIALDNLLSIIHAIENGTIDGELAIKEMSNAIMEAERALDAHRPPKLKLTIQ